MAVKRGEGRDIVYKNINENPGIHLREISRRTGLTFGGVLYNLDKLLEADLVSFEIDGKLKKYYPKSTSSQSPIA